MDNEKWHCVLVEWVNCLKLGKNIRNVNELRSGEFFSTLQKIIKQNREENCEILSFIFKLLGEHYPNYNFENKTEMNLSDFPEVDLKSVTSLLMHYTSIYNRRDVMTAPIYGTLSQSTQLIIINFVQKITKTITNDLMNDVIKSCIDDLVKRNSRVENCEQFGKNSEGCEKGLKTSREYDVNVLSVNSQLLEMVVLRKELEERKAAMNHLSLIKKAHINLLKVHIIVLMKIHNIEYKQTRDKVEYVQLLKKKWEEIVNLKTKNIEDLQAEYESKAKMLKLYDEEVNNVEWVNKGIEEQEDVDVEDEDCFQVRASGDRSEDTDVGNGEGDYEDGD